MEMQDLFLVSEDGITYRFNAPGGSSIAWTALSAPNTSDMTAISMLNDVDGWAVGGGSTNTLWRWGGSGWTALTLPTGSGRPYGVYATNANETWVVGAAASSPSRWGIWRRNGSGAWTNFNPGGTIRTLYAVQVIDSDGNGAGDFGIAAGDDSGGDNSVFRYNGSSWLSAAPPSAHDWQAVSIVSPTDAWIAGDGGAIYRWNGSIWNSAASPTGNLIQGMEVISTTGAATANYGWIVGPNNTVFSYDSGVWTNRAMTPTAVCAAGANNNDIDLYDVHIFAKDDVWVVGECTRPGPDALMVVHWNGTTWDQSQLIHSANALLPVRLSGLWVPPSRPYQSGGAWQQVFP
jgi:hypothetical protein